LLYLVKNLYQMSDETVSLIEGLQQLDQTVPANLAAAAAAAAAATAAANMVNTLNKNVCFLIRDAII
jgi:hypothetical protein